MNTYDIYLRGGQVVTVESVVGPSSIIGVWQKMRRDEFEYWQFENGVTVLTKSIVGFKDKTRELEKEPAREINLQGLNKPYKPWNEQK